MIFKTTSTNSTQPPDARKNIRDTLAHSVPGGSGMPSALNDPAQSYGDTASLFDATGRRKYLNSDERSDFTAAAEMFNPEIEALCLLLHFTGCRISEALALNPSHLDSGSHGVIFRTLKQRKKSVFRMIPVPDMVMEKLRRCVIHEDTPIFGWHRSTAWEKITAVMSKAGIVGPQATPRGTRHGFGVAAVSAGVPITLVQRWLGHARLETTSIYLAVTGPEEREFASRLWPKPKAQIDCAQSVG